MSPARASIRTKDIVLTGILSAFLLALDQASKIAVVKGIPFASRTPVIPGIFNLTYITNRGAAWGMLSGYGWLLLCISIAVLIGIVVFIKPLSDGWAERVVALLMICSGIMGNSMDRVFRGEVVDFLDFYVKIGKEHHWPAFNVADSCICVGVAVFIISSLLRPEAVSKGSGNGFVQYPL